MSSVLVAQQSARGLAARQSSLPGLCPVAQAVEVLATDAGIKARGAVFTRREIVEFLLDLCGYRADRPLHKLKLLEPSFGGGDFLLPAIERLLAAWNTSNDPRIPVKALAGAIRAVELHRETFTQTRGQVIDLLSRSGLTASQSIALADAWLVNDDFLLADLPDPFDVVIGNPPYVRQERVPDVLLTEYRSRYTTIYDRADPNQGSPDQLAPADTNIATDTAQSNESEASREISRIILPGGPGDQSTAPAVPGAEDATDDSGPRKVRTVVVKPDGTIVSSEAAPRGATDTAPAATVPDNAPLPPSDAPPSMAANDMAPAGSDDTAPAASAPVGSAKDNSQLQPPSPPQPAETTVAAAPTVAPEPPPAAATAPPVTGGFVVQVTSQRSEQAAVAAFKNLQKKFPSVLGDRTPDIARADLGAKGVYFRARVGPMATRDEAVSFCEQLRAAGGDCIVQKN